MREKPPERPIVHIYPPRYPHEAVEIIGNQRGLENLVNAVIDAVGEGSGRCEISTSDGHASEVRAIRLKGRRRPEEWRRSGSPYWDIANPLVATILDLSEENSRLRQAIASRRAEREVLGE